MRFTLSTHSVVCYLCHFLHIVKQSNKCLNSSIPILPHFLLYAPLNIEVKILTIFAFYNVDVSPDGRLFAKTDLV